MTDEFVKLLDQGCANLGIELSKQQKEQFFKYYEMLIEKNKVMNLTAITELSDVITKHFVDSLLLVLAAPELGLKLDGFIRDKISALFHKRDTVLGKGGHICHRPGYADVVLFPVFRIASVVLGTSMDSRNIRKSQCLYHLI